MQKKSTLRGSALLAATALVWGFGFVAQSAGLAYLGPLTFNGARSLIAALALVPATVLADCLTGRRPSLWGTRDTAQRRQLLAGGLACGLVLAVAATLQNAGMRTTSVGKSGFLTALYILLVPLLGIPFGQRPPRRLWLAVALATGGMYLLCVKGDFSIAPGDLLLILSALTYAVHIRVIDHFTRRTDGVRLSCLQFLVCGLVCTLAAPFFERTAGGALLGALVPLLYSGVISAGLGYTLQILGQRDTDPTVASLVLSLEAVFAALGGWLLLGQTLSRRESLGCVLVFAAILLAQLPAKKAAPAGTPD